MPLDTGLFFGEKHVYSSQIYLDKKELLLFLKENNLGGNRYLEVVIVGFLFVFSSQSMLSSPYLFLLK